MEELGLPSSESSLRFSRDVEHISTLDPTVEDQIIQHHTYPSSYLSQIFIIHLSIFRSYNAVPQHHLSSRSRDSVRISKLLIKHVTTNKISTVHLQSFTAKLSASPTATTTPSEERHGALVTTGK